ncbi:glycosyltransferase family 4 protein [Candidatus Woesearchaeota archaeon]|nr:glycosyltransferase family 4 protein [Candidatus Woesearchaeota archaeon]
MKIAILTPTFSHYSGIDRVAEQQAEEYASKGSDVTVFALESSIRPKGFKIEVLGMPKTLLIQRMYRLLFFLDRKKIKKTAEKLKGYDVAISHFYPMNLIAHYAKKKHNVKYVYYNHGIGYSWLFDNFFERIYMKLFGLFNRLSLRYADEAVSISKFLQKELKDETGLDSKVIYNRIDRKRFRNSLDGSKIRKALKVKGDGKLLLFVGRISPHKNIHSLLKIFDLVVEKMPDCKLLIVGKPTFPSYYSRLKEAANKNVIFMDFVNDKKLPNYYAACDLYVTASLWEGFNLPAAEAQACGKKVVAFDVCSHPEIVKSGILVGKGNIEGFADAALRLLK